MTSVDNNEPERGGDDIVAAEYVLGVLPAAERTAAARRIDAGGRLRASRRTWEGSFLAAGGRLPAGRAAGVGQDRARSAAVCDRRRSAERQSQPGLWSSLAFWRGLAAAAVAAFAIYIAMPYINPPVAGPADAAGRLARRRRQRRAAISPSTTRATGEVALSHVSGERGAGHDFELWMIEGSNAPVSMGVIPVGDTAQLASQAGDQRQARQGCRACHQPRAGRRFADRPADRTVVAVGDLKSI